MSFRRNNIVHFGKRKRRKTRSPGRRSWRHVRLDRWSTLVVLTLVGILTIAHLLGYGAYYPTLVDMLTGGANSAAGAPEASRLVEGTARVIDGDTLDVHGVRIRLHGIDAPERNQTCHLASGRAWACGSDATAKMRALAGGKHVSCEVRDRDRYGRFVSICRVNGTDIESAMVRAGLALAYRQYSRAYVGDEAYAKQHKTGMWAGTFEPPWDWRRHH